MKNFRTKIVLGLDQYLSTLCATLGARRRVAGQKTAQMPIDTFQDTHWRRVCGPTKAMRECLPSLVLSVQRPEDTLSLDTGGCECKDGCIQFHGPTTKFDKLIGQWSTFLKRWKMGHDTAINKDVQWSSSCFHWGHTLEGSQSKITACQSTFPWIMNQVDMSGRPGRLHLDLSKLEFEVIAKADIKDQAADALFCLPCNLLGRTDINDALPVLMALLPDHTNEAIQENEKCQIKDEGFDQIESKLPAVSLIATASTPPTEPTTAEYLPVSAEDIICRVFASSIRPLVSDCAYDGNILVSNGPQCVQNLYLILQVRGQPSK